MKWVVILQIWYQRTNDEGEFYFNEVEKGEYKVAFSIQSEQDRRDKIPTPYEENGKTANYFGAVITNAFEYDNSKVKTLQIPSFIIGWKANLTTYKKKFYFGETIKFSWSKVDSPLLNSYSLVILDKQKYKVFETPELIDNEYIFEDSKLKKLEKNQEYTYFVKIKYNKPTLSDIYITEATSSFSSFKIE